MTGPQIEILLDERPRSVAAGTTLHALRDEAKPNADIAIVNGFPLDEDRTLEPGDAVVFIRRGEHPAPEDLEALLAARHGPGVHARVRRARVGIAGCGGLGSAVAVALARTGIGGLVLADFDVVEPSNLNRQQFFVDQIGLLKVDALAENLSRIHPGVRIERHALRLSRDNAGTVFQDCDVIAECLDAPSSKAEIVAALRKVRPGAPIVAVSGIAGTGTANAITTRQAFAGTWLVGDGETAAAPGCGLLAPRVAVAAGHQAHAILRLLLGMEAA